MLKTLASISALLVGYSFLFIGNALLTTLVSLRAELEDFATLNIGLINAAYFLGLFIGAKYCDLLVARSGHSRAYAVFASLAAVCALLHALVVLPYVWMIIRLGTGICGAALMMITESWLNSKATRTTRGQILSVYMITHVLASGSGQLLIPFADLTTFRLFSVAAIGYCLALLPVLISQHSAPRLPKREKIKFIEIFRYSKIGMSGAFCCGLVSSALYGLTPIFVKTTGASTTITAWFMALLIYGGGVLQWPVGKFSDRFDRRKLIAWMSLVSGLLSILVLTSAQLDLIYFLSSAVLFGAFSFTLYPLALAHINDSTPDGKLLYASAGMLTAFSIGAIFGPVLAAATIEIFGYAALFWNFSVIYVLYALLVLWRIRIRPAPKKKRFRRFFRGSTRSGISSKTVQDEIDKDIIRMIGGHRR